MRHDQDEYAEVEPDRCPDCGERIIPMNLPGSGWQACGCDVPDVALTREEYYEQSNRRQLNGRGW